MLVDTSTLLVGLTTLSAVAWVVAFAGSIASSQDIKYFPKFTWWGLVFELVIVVGLPVVFYTGRLETCRPFMLCCTGVAFIYASNAVNNLVYYTDSSTAAASAGFIILSMGNFVWMFYLGTTGDVSERRTRSVSLSNKPPAGSTANLAGGEIRGLENIELSTTNSASASSQNDMYPVIVRGLYDYTASTDDANELSFKKGEMLRVENTLGNWWLGRNAKGEVGMCPSNYLEIV